MKRNFNRCIVMILMTFISQLSFAAANYKLDPDHTYIVWHVSHFGFSTVSGKVTGEGTLMFDDKNPAQSTVEATLHINSMTTCIAKLDDILTGKNFFDTSEFPSATFKSSKVVVTGKDTGKIYGTLTIRGIAKDVVLDMKLNQQGDHPFYHKPALGFSGSTTIKRSDFGMRGYIPGVSDDTQIEIQSEAILNSN